MKRLYYDFEVYPNFWLVVFKDEKKNKIVIHSEMSYQPHIKRLKEQLDNFVFVGYNNNRYDTVMLNYILQVGEWKKKHEMINDMYAMSLMIVEDNVYSRQVMANYKIASKTYEMDVSSFLMVGTSAKEMGCRMHHPKLETLPFDPHEPIDFINIPKLSEYCENDVDIVIKIAEEMVAGKMAVVTDVIDYWGLDRSLMSSTLSHIVEQALVDDSLKPNKPTKWRYIAPVDFNFKTREFKDIEETYKGLILEPNYKFSLTFDIDRMETTVAMGGAHGAVRQSYFENLIDIDVNQFYPVLLYEFNFLPNTIKDKEIYGKLIEDKKRYSETNDPRVSAVKESINAIYGRMGFENSRLYAPDKLYQTTITGQLLQLRLIEDLRAGGFEVVYLNTDGLTILDNSDDSYKDIVQRWADEFNVEYKTANFKRAYYRDVNNFIAEDTDGNLKRKGELSTEPSKKAASFGKVAVDAVVEHLIHGTNIRDYIAEVNDLREYLMYHKYNRDMDVFLQSGNELKPLSNVVRYYISTKSEDSIVHRKQNSETLENRKYNKNVILVNDFKEVDGIVPITADLDKEHYVRMAFDILGKVRGMDVEDNPYIMGLLKDIGVTEIGQKRLE